jgi:DNA-binding transcriptional LysR family regulator
MSQLSSHEGASSTSFVGLLALYGSPPTLEKLVAEALRATRAALSIDVEVVEGEPYELLPRVVTRELDLAVVFSYEGQAASISFEGRPLGGREPLESDSPGR